MYLFILFFFVNSVLFPHDFCAFSQVKSTPNMLNEICEEGESGDDTTGALVAGASGTQRKVGPAKSLKKALPRKARISLKEKKSKKRQTFKNKSF